MPRWDVLRAAAHRSLGVACIALLLLAVGCGPLGDDDDEEPTATPDTASPIAAGSPVAGATPRGGPVQVTRPPTTGSPTPGRPDDETESTPVDRPTRTPEPEGTSTPEESPEPTSAPERTPTPPSVEGCEEPEELPEVQGETDRVTSPEADEGVNLRAGPGADCDVLATLQPNTAVVVESGPVQAGDLLWVKIVVGDTEGWVAEQFLAPAEDEAEE